MGNINLAGRLAQSAAIGALAIGLALAPQGASATSLVTFSASFASDTDLTLNTNWASPLLGGIAWGTLDVDDDGNVWMNTLSDSLASFQVFRPNGDTTHFVNTNRGDTEGHGIVTLGDNVFVYHSDIDEYRPYDRSDLLAVATPGTSNVSANAAERSGFDMLHPAWSYAADVVPAGFSQNGEGYDGKLIVADGSSQAFIVDPVTGATSFLTTNSQSASGYAFSLDGQTLYQVGGSSPLITTFDSSGTAGVSFDLSTIGGGGNNGHLAAIETNPVTGELFVLGDDGKLFVITPDFTSALQIAEQMAGTWPMGLAFSNDGDTLYFADPQEEVLQTISGLRGGILLQGIEDEPDIPLPGLAGLFALGALTLRRQTA